LRPRLLAAPALLLALAAAGCSPSRPAPDGGAEPLDGTGVAVAVPERAMRIVSLAPDLTQTLFALGAGDAVVGVSTACDRPAAALEGRARVGSMVEPSLESILALEPDLVLASADGNPLATLVRLRELGVTVYGVKPAAGGLAGVLERLSAIGAASGRTSEAGELVATLESQFSAVRRAAEGREPLTCCWLVWEDPPVAAGRGTFLEGLMQLVGLENACARGDEGWPRLSREDLLVAGPQALVLASGGHGDAASGLGSWASSLPAFRDDRVLTVDPDDYSRPTLELGPAAGELLELTRPWTEGS
jgi:iron complex transport system substrate-binding protein